MVRTRSQSKRKREDDDGNKMEAKRRFTLLDLPEEILQTTLSTYLSTVSDQFALQSTNQLFRKISNSSEMRQKLSLTPDDSATGNNDSDAFSIIGKEDSSLMVTQWLLPFAEATNLDALLVLGLIATYVEDDLQTGLALFQKGAQEGDIRAKYELANLLLRLPSTDPRKKAGQAYIDEAAASGHAPSILSRSSISFTLRKRVKNELRTTACLQHLLARKPNPPRRRWGPRKCGHPLCSRRDYKPSRRSRAWLQDKGYSLGWQQCRSQVLACGVPSPHFCQKDFYCVPAFLFCSRCRQVTYCSRACQVMHWKIHKAECVEQP